MAQGLSTSDPSLSPTHLSIRRGRATTIHYTHHQVSLMVSCNTTLVPSLGLRIGPACEAGLSVGMRRERVPPQMIKIKDKDTASRLHLLSKISLTSFSTYFFTHIHLMRCLLSVVNIIAVTTLLLTSSLNRCYQRIFKKNTNYFYAVRISILIAIFESYARKRSGCFFLNTVYCHF